jgi:hypothetical protein
MWLSATYSFAFAALSPALLQAFTKAQKIDEKIFSQICHRGEDIFCIRLIASS